MALPVQSIAKALGRSPFQLVCKHGKRDCANVLWNRRSSISCRLIFNTTDVDGQSPFHAACESGCVPLVIWLYEHGAEIEAPAVGHFSAVPSETEETEQWKPQYAVNLRSSPLVCATIYQQMGFVKFLLG